MAIEDRNLAVGTKLAAKYKKQWYTCEVVQTEEGVRYRLEDGRTFKSPSAAATALMGGQAANGWRFWSLATGGATGAEQCLDGQEGEAGVQQPTTAAVSAAAGKQRAVRIIKKTANQKGTPEGQVRWFCSACGDSFFAPAGAAPTACPKGHQAELDANGELVTAPVAALPEAPEGDQSAEAVAAD